MTTNPFLLSDLPPWQQPAIVRWSEILARSYRQLLGKKLIDEDCADTDRLSKALFYAPFVVVSHGTQADPILNYGNQTALELWSMDWQQLTKTPSRLTAEPVNREDRTLMLDRVTRQGYIDNYRGIRISSTGRRFLIKGVTIWNLTDNSGKKCGQAATFANWTWFNQSTNADE